MLFTLMDGLLNASFLAVSMFFGAVVGFTVFIPAVSHGPADELPRCAIGAFIGAIAGCIAWKLYRARSQGAQAR
jgi:hypothetical protein